MDGRITSDGRSPDQELDRRRRFDRRARADRALISQLVAKAGRTLRQPVKRSPGKPGG